MRTWRAGSASARRFQSRAIRVFTFLPAVLLYASLSSAAAPDLELPVLAIRPGTPSEVTLLGSDFPERPTVWTSFPAQIELVDEPQSSEARYRITVPGNTPVGIGVVRIFGSNGVSNLSFMMLDDLPNVAESKTNKNLAAAQSVEIGTAVEGRCEDLTYDWFKLRANKGQRIALEIVASRLGSKLDSLVRVMDARGLVVAQNDDAPGLRADSVVSFTSAEASDYLVEVRDVNYGGGPDFFYRLRIGDFPLATTTFPIAAEEGSQLSFQLAGPDGMVGRSQAAVPTNRLTIPLALKGRAGSTFARGFASTTHEVMEREPNDKVANATKVLLSEGINGRFDKLNDRDCYEFTASEGQRIEFRAATRSVGSPCDVMLELQSAGGARLARSNPSSADEGMLTHRFASNGVYRLAVEEAIGGFGPNCVYHIGAQSAAGFDLTVDNDRINVEPGKAFELKVTCVRGDYKGPVTLSIKSDSDALTITNNVIGEGKTNTTMKVTVPENFAPALPRFFSVIGTATRDGAEMRVRASTGPALRRRFPQMLYLPVELEGVIALGLTAPK